MQLCKVIYRGQRSYKGHTQKRGGPVELDSSSARSNTEVRKVKCLKHRGEIKRIEVKTEKGSNKEVGGGSML